VFFALCSLKAARACLSASAGIALKGTSAIRKAWQAYRVQNFPNGSEPTVELVHRRIIESSPFIRYPYLSDLWHDLLRRRTLRE
jgi:hypothetical protein